MYTEKSCRVCLSVSEDLTPLRVRLPGADKTLADTIHFALNVIITFEDGLPDKICNDCWTMVNVADTIKQRILESERILSQLDKGKGSDETHPSFAIEGLENGEIYSEDASCLPTAISRPLSTDSLGDELHTEKNIYDYPEFKIKMVNVENNVSEESPASVQESLDVKGTLAKSIEQLSPKEEGPGITESNMDKTNKDSARITANVLKLSDSDIGSSTEKQSKCLNNTVGKVVTCDIGEFTTNHTHVSDKPSSSPTVCKQKLSQKRVLVTGTDHKRYVCDVCNKKFRGASALDNHVRTHTGDKPFSCNVCKKNFSEKSYVTKHMRIHTGEKPYSCHVCNKRFTQTCSLDNHLRTHTGDKPFSCNVCYKNFSLKPNLTKHMRVHTGEKPYSCDVCKKKFRDKTTLNVHVKIHTGNKPYLCDVCKKGFAQASSLKTHVRTHTGDKSHSCNVCKKNFSQKCNLTTHKKIHTGEKPYSCKLCEKKFTQACSLNAHVSTHTGVKPYSCEVCKKNFRIKSTLTAHVRRRHTGDYPYSCDVCEKKFQLKHNLVSHIKIHKMKYTGKL